LPAVLVNPRVGVPTADVFRALAAIRAKDAPRAATADPATTMIEQAAKSETPLSTQDLIATISRSRNDLEGPAITVQPVIADVLGALQTLPGCRLARMSGSGATCFALFERNEAARAARRLKAQHPDWWVKPTTLGAG
jgi:4-diphosphocytidyl-2-C-methyl-D-erythritol kinase